MIWFHFLLKSKRDDIHVTDDDYDDYNHRNKPGNAKFDGKKIMQWIDTYVYDVYKHTKNTIQLSECVCDGVTTDQWPLLANGCVCMCVSVAVYGLSGALPQ